jgi:hypothetical protein
MRKIEREPKFRDWHKNHVAAILNPDYNLERPEPQLSNTEIYSFVSSMVDKVDWQPDPIGVLMVMLRRLANIARYSERPEDIQDAVTLINHQLFINSQIAPKASDRFEAEARDRAAA